MRQSLLFLCSIAIVSALTLPVRVLTTKEAPGVIDTQGQSVWVTSSYCQPSYCSSKNRFQMIYSNTYTNMVENFYQSDHLGEVEGTTGFDTFIFGQIANRSTVVNKKFGLATDLPVSIAYAPGVDGVLGLAGVNGRSFMDDAYNEGSWNADVVTYWLENQWETKDNGTHGVLYYGNYDNLHCNYSYYVQNTDPNIYKFTSTGLYVYGNTSVLYSSSATRQVILTSTSPYITVPSNVAASILTSLGLSSNTPLPATVDCNKINSMRFLISNAKSTETVTGLNLIIPQPDGTCKLAMTISQSSSGDGSNGHIELGIPFFRGRCTYLDRSQGTIGFGIPGVRVPGGKK